MIDVRVSRWLQRVVSSVLAIAAGCTISPPASAQSAPSGYLKAFRYDEGGRLLGTISPPATPGGTRDFLATRNAYDSLGRLASVETGVLASWQSDGVAPADWQNFDRIRIETYDYDANGRRTKVSISDSSGAPQSVVQTSYDDYDRQICTAIRMDDTQWTTQGDACTPQLNAAAGADRVTRYSYDALGRTLKVEKAVGTALAQSYATYTYTATGKIDSSTDANGNVSKWHYNSFDEPDKLLFPSRDKPGSWNDDDYEYYEYDSAGNRTAFRKRDGRTISTEYDANNRPSRKSGAVPAVVYKYDLRGLLTSATYEATGRGIANAFDGFGFQTGTTDTTTGASRSLTFGSDREGVRTRITYPDQAMIAFESDGLGRLATVKESGQTSVAGIAWTRTGVRESETRGAVTSRFSFDALDRLTSQTDDFVGASWDNTTGLRYNHAGQIVERTRSNDVFGFTRYVARDLSYTPNGLNQYASLGYSGQNRSYAYDTNGNLTGDGEKRYQYDAENRLVQVSTLDAGTGQVTSDVFLSYDPLGRLNQVSASQSGTTQFLYDGDQLTVEYGGDGAIARRYVHGPGTDDPLLWYEGPGLNDRRSLHADHLGSIVAVADAAGYPTVYSYDDYGLPGTRQTGRFQYTGQAWLPEIGMYHYKARVYSPTLGRFMQTDPVGYKDQMNLYAYVGDDPVNHTDSTGNETGTFSNGCMGDSCINIDPGGKVHRGALEVLGTIASVGSILVPEGIAIKGLEALGRALGIGEKAVDAAKVETAAKGLTEIGSHAGESIAARSAARDFTNAERAQINKIGSETGCHSCGTTSPGTKTGNFVPDHQPPSSLNSSGSPQRLYPQCLSCSRQQGLEIAKKLREGS